MQTVTRLFARDNQAEETHILVTAPTGAAAYNVSGYTLHSAFLLPLNTKASDDYVPLTGEKLAGLKESIGNIKLLTIDEISMVGADMLLIIHRRLCDIMTSDEPFGGISVLAVGDLLQLPPVAQRSVFALPSDEIAAVYGSLWQTHFRILELHEIQRQKEDQTFAAVLNRIRTGDQTEDDLSLLKSRAIQPSSDAYPVDSTHIFAYNKQVNEHNIARLHALPEPHFTFKAKDSKRDDQTGAVSTSAFKDKNGGLPSSLSLAVDARVMLTKNIDVSDGLVNTACGIVTGFLPAPHPPMNLDTFVPKYVLVHFDDDRVGKNLRSQSKSILPDLISTPISAVETQVSLGRHSKVTAKRTQFPLALAWAVTIHKEPGKTEDSLVVSTERSLQAGQFYTAVSRPKDLQGLFILGDVQTKNIKINLKSLEEIKRMTKQAPFIAKVPNVLLCDSTLYLKITSFNTNSFHSHQKCVEKERIVLSSHICCFTETWLRHSDSIPEFSSQSSL